MDLPTAIAQSCDTYFYRVGNKFYDAAAPTAASRSRSGRARFGFGRDERQRPRARSRPASCRRSAGSSSTYTKANDPNWRDRPPLEAGRLAQARDRPGLPARDAAPDGALLRGDRERRQARHAARPHGRREPERNDRPDDRRRRRRARFPGLDPAYLEVVQQGLFEATHDSFGTSYGVFGNFPVQIAGKTGTAQKVVQLPGYHGRARPVVVVRLWSGERREARRLRRDRERRRGRGGRRAGGRTGLREVLQRPGDPDRVPHPLRLMAD